MSVEMDVKAKEKLIMEVRSFPVVYNSAHAKHKDRNTVNNSWLSISKNMGMEVKLCRTTWEGMRDYYWKQLKAMKQPSGSGASKISKWHFFDQMSFMADHLVQREGTGNLTLEAPDTPPTIDSQSESETGNDPDTSVDGILTAAKPKPFQTAKRNKRSLADDPFQREILSTLAQTKDDEFDIFGSSVAVAIRNLPSRRKQVELKLKINQMIAEAELESIDSTVTAGYMGDSSVPTSFASAMSVINSDETFY